MVIKTKYKFGDVLYLKTDPEQFENTLIAVVQEPGALVYRIRTCDGEMLEVYEFEVSDVKDPLKSMGLNINEDGRS